MLRIAAETTLGELELDVAAEVAAGECLALAGPSGAGKSSVLRVIAGLLRPRRGAVACGERVWLDTQRGTDLPPDERRCGYVFQDYALFPHLSAWQNVAYALTRVPRRERRPRAVELLERFGVGDRADARPRTLSGGERQRVALARALAVEPAALLLDEPLSALDARTRAAAGRELAAVLHAAGVPALLVTHDFQEAALLGDRVGVMDGGRIVQVGTASELAAEPVSPFVADFTGAVVLTGVAAPAADGLTRVTLDGGGEVSSPEPAAGPVAVTVYPWEIALAPSGTRDAGSARNHLEVEIVSVTAVGSRVRVGLAAPQPLAAELTGSAVVAMHIAPGQRAVATWKATATRLLPLTTEVGELRH
ncbi:MAG TPA: ABC transporter ATP-binding protein [Solirubrobacteraceae bacterium]|nr:ABC transporter ATP-binding protein [Solirubrobacteraceae bacterium]